MTEEQLIPVYILSNPGWAQDMVLTSMDDVLATVMLEIDELDGTKADGIEVEIHISRDLWTKNKVESLPEFYG